jgi:predicted GNAT superfamily acetyltransferase
MAGVQAAGTKGVSEGMVVRRCGSMAELEACVALQQEVWNFADSELVPLRLFVIAQKIGGQVLGAFGGSELVGYALSIPGTRAGRPFLHSHMLAVRAAYRNSGLGRRLKLFQRQDALEHGYELIEWTFDPLEIKNAYLNLNRLGAIARRYNINQYGVTTSPLHGGLPSDRLVAEWWLRSRRVEMLLARGALPAYQIEQRVTVPAQIYDWKASSSDRDKAAEVQLRNREQLIPSFEGGFTALVYERDEQGNGSFLLGRWDEQWSYGS